jgi:hypothetical protein
MLNDYLKKKKKNYKKKSRSEELWKKSNIYGCLLEVKNYGKK